MPLKSYGVLKGKAIEVRLGAGSTPHYQVRIVDDTTDYRIAINVKSQLRLLEVRREIERLVARSAARRATAAERARFAELAKAFELDEIAEKPVRQLSLGERMRCELVASLLHRPEILFLDEPTIGLDVVAKATIRDLVRERSLRVTLVKVTSSSGNARRMLRWTLASGCCSSG